MSHSPEIDPDDPLTEHVFPDEPPSRAVVRAVAERDGVGAMDLRPLGVVLDADALDALLDSAPGTAGADEATGAAARAPDGSGSADATGATYPDGDDADGDDVARVSFSYAGYRVTALAGGTVRLAAESADRPDGSSGGRVSE